MRGGGGSVLEVTPNFIRQGGNVVRVRVNAINF